MWQDFLTRLLAFLLLFTGISAPAVPAPHPASSPAAQDTSLPSLDPESVQPYLRAALSFAPPQTEWLAFTDWEGIKLHQAARDVTSASPMQERRDFLRSLSLDEAAASGFALAYFALQAEQWGWDTTDLLWEATVQGPGAPVFILRLRDDFDMDGLLARFAERDFERTAHAGALVYTHPLDLTASWRTELAVFNAAVLPDENVLIHSSDPSAILPVLEAHAGTANWQNNRDILSVAAAFGPARAALLASGPQVCADFGFAALLPVLLGDAKPSAEELASLQRKYFGDAPLHPYLVLGISYRYVAHLEGIIAMHYPSREAAEADLEARRELAANGQSTAAEAPIREVLFFDPITTVDFRNNILLNVRPTGDRPQRLFNMFYRRDMPFAACS